jgi:hypothetical protein
MTLLRFLRYWLPGLVCLIGFVLAVVRGFDDTGLDTMAAMFGAGGSIYLMNVLLRVGISGDRERDVEDDARAFFDRHGMWPDEVPPGWTAPPEDAPQDQPPPRRPVHKAGPTSGGPGSRRGRGGRGR